MTVRAGIIGGGTIASCLKKRLIEAGCGIAFELCRRSVTIDGRDRSGDGLSFESILELARPDAVFIAISTEDTGEAAREYLLACASAGIKAITCEKGALAYHSDVLRPHFDSIGFSAAVGGGTGMLSHLRGRYPTRNKYVQMQAVLNGTLNFVFDTTSREGRTFQEACSLARDRGYVESGGGDDLDLVNRELKDILLKTCVLFNTALARTRPITPDVLEGFTLGRRALDGLIERPEYYRFVVTISNHPAKAGTYFADQAFGARMDGWHVEGGFRHIEWDTELISWLPTGRDNALRLVEGESGSCGTYLLTGPGAGAEPTTTAMLNDLYAMI